MSRPSSQKKRSSKHISDDVSYVTALSSKQRSKRRRIEGVDLVAAPLVSDSSSQSSQSSVDVSSVAAAPSKQRSKRRGMEGVSLVAAPLMSHSNKRSGQSSQPTSRKVSKRRNVDLVEGSVGPRPTIHHYSPSKRSKPLFTVGRKQYVRMQHESTRGEIARTDGYVRSITSIVGSDARRRTHYSVKKRQPRTIIGGRTHLITLPNLNMNTLTALEVDTSNYVDTVSCDLGEDYSQPTSPSHNPSKSQTSTTNTNAKRSEAATNPISVWQRVLDECHDIMLDLEVETECGQARAVRCAGEGCPSSLAAVFYRCRDCVGGGVFCQSCISARHCHSPFHRLQVWLIRRTARINSQIVYIVAPCRGRGRFIFRSGQPSCRRSLGQSSSRWQAVSSGQAQNSHRRGRTPNFQHGSCILRVPVKSRHERLLPALSLSSLSRHCPTA